MTIDKQKSLKERYDEVKKLERKQQFKRKLEDYERMMNSKLCEMLYEERIKEDERLDMLSNCKNETEKKRLEKILAMEKSQANEKIIDFNK